MTGPTAGQFLTLGLHPTARGFGWSVFSHPFAPHDWGVVTIHKDKNARCIARVEHLLERLTPETLVLEEFDGTRSSRSGRIRRLCQAIVALARDRSIDVAIYTRTDIAACFRSVGARTRDEIAHAVARHVQHLRHRLPPKRRDWQSEHPRMALFCAAALVLTHYHLGAARLLDELKGEE
jgi:Holliday junction resolvasome RuvABC endonuclease subunit